MKRPSHLISIGLLAVFALFAGSASAGFEPPPPPPWIQQSQVTDVVTDMGGSWNYQFTVFNDSQCTIDPPTCYLEFGEPIIIDWELPYYDDMGINNILSPAGWDYSIETIGVANPVTGWTGVAAWQDPADPFGDPDGPFGINNLSRVLHWYVPGAEFNPACNTALFPGDAVSVPAAVGPAPPCPGIATPDTPLPSPYYIGSLDGFGFDADFAPTAAPYATSWLVLEPISGDPAFPFGGLPGSPSVIGEPIPLPSVLALMSLGLLGIGARLHRRSA